MGRCYRIQAQIALATRRNVRRRASARPTYISIYAAVTSGASSRHYATPKSLTRPDKDMNTARRPSFRRRMT